MDSYVEIVFSGRGKVKLMKAPFPWFGGKSRVAHLVWDRFGNVPNYVEPFFGSGAVLLARPWPARTETVNDLDCMVANFWRALRPRGQIIAYMRALAERLRRVRVCCGDWKRLCGPSVTIKYGITGVFLDPPYSDEAGRRDNLYASDSGSVAHAVASWALEWGERRDMRIALCGYEGEHAIPASWECVEWKAAGYGSQGNGSGRENAGRERIWFSPHCPKPKQGLFSESMGWQ